LEDSDEVPDEYQDEEDNADEIADYGYSFGHGGSTEDDRDAEPDEDYELEGYQNSTQAVDAAEDSESEVFLGTDSDQEVENEYGEYGFGSY
jgi:hypothetical protein